ncbi:YfcC family protein [Sansalvadorimonas sp. 2012CJ34-2]|uniref:YfcC family protein n=1 Tax=Parendozoicomonas callyspongiae TaxID=2942213 RepID=A0ABT0PL12_9GAMM|nr:YfcC family protein [Sansalvadorimonas sp. 2012CJ34-2]MCL6272080.1 YfcC family protein [Sansalvadorimonas sp. 2012CJ34-2]
MGKFKFPSAYTVLVAIIVFVAALTYIVPAGQYDRVMNDALGKEVPVAGTYQVVESTPQGFFDVVMAPIAGFFDPITYEAGAIDVALFVLIIGGFLGVVTKTGAIDAGIAQVTKAMEGREKWMIPILMGLFAAGGTSYGMAEETLPFYMLLIPVVIAAGYDALTGVAIVMLGAGMGVLGSTINPFATVIASDAAGISFADGMPLRFVILALSYLIGVVYVMRYAEKVRKDPKASMVADQKESNEEFFLKNTAEVLEFTAGRKLILAMFTVTFGIMIWGVSKGGWWMAEMSALFLVASIVIGLAGRLSEEELTGTFIDGARDLLGVAFVIAIARGIVVIMNAGNITDTILFWCEHAVTGLSEVVFINVMYWIQVVLSFFIPSTSGLAVLSMPVMAPLADFANVGRDLVVTAYQSASGVVNLITPTSGVVMGGLAIGRVSYAKWVKFVMPLVVIMTVFLMAVLSIATMI